ncbi:MAG TPA: DUF971 domain-containing protein [Xanthobacteraceae bacterium]|nr:DUF971 domain-containing protein [Xanthobacteraceae bacterium]
MVIDWSDGRLSHLSAQLLRTHSRAAEDVRRRVDQRALDVPADLRVDHVEPVGNYAVRLHFSDGSNRGIYPWAYLRELSGLSDRG